MVDERLQEFFKIVKIYHRQNPVERIKMLGGFIRAASMTHADIYTRGLLSRFYFKEFQKHANKNPGGYTA